MQRLAPELAVVDLVATAELGQPVDLEKLVYIKGFLYDPQQAIAEYGRPREILIDRESQFYANESRTSNNYESCFRTRRKLSE